MEFSSGRLQAAHRGYMYQDLFTAYFLVRGLFDRYTHVIVDRKQVIDDRIDDLQIKTDSATIRRQFKSSEDQDRVLQLNDFIGPRSSLRIDRLVLTHTNAQTEPNTEYRLCATWGVPTASEEIFQYLEPIEATPSLDTSNSPTYRLRTELIWPESSEPTWSPLVPFQQAGAEFTRQQFVEFCDIFIIELELPKSSKDLNNPGPLERKLISDLSERVGVGKYPNHMRSATDVAALAIYTAQFSRSASALVTPADVENRLAISTDFGRITQAFPIDENTKCVRDVFQRQLRENIQIGKHQLVIAPPGCGKSWEMTQLANTLQNPTTLVAKHYCYLEPGDALAERRVTSDVFFGNLLAEIVDAAPHLATSSTSRYSAGLAELEETLQEASNQYDRIILIIDGLDHIARVVHESNNLSPDETGIIEMVSSIRLPPQARMVIASQPGDHLTPIRDRFNESITEVQVPNWSIPELVNLSGKFNLPDALITNGFLIEQRETITQNLCTKSDGNPLYCRYLSLGLITGLSDGSVSNPNDWINSIPNLDGDINQYYSYLYNAVSDGGRATADILSVIDFSVTTTDLTEILSPAHSGWIPSEISALTPVLSQTAGQGGLRIFHESFRRFMIAELNRLGRPQTSILETVITWLDTKQFFLDAKSYRHLFSLLQQAHREGEVLQKIDADFVTKSVANGHQLNPILVNLTIAVKCASTDQNWSKIAACIELHRAANTAFDEHNNDWTGFWEGYLEMFGPHAVAERMLFDGKPTLPWPIGLQVCSLLDDAGGVAPWDSYLPSYETTDNEQNYHDRDPDGPFTEKELLTLAVIHGDLKFRETRSFLNRIIRFIISNGEHLRFDFARAISARVTRAIGKDFMLKLSRGGRRRNIPILPEISVALQLGVCDELKRSDRMNGNERIPNSAVQICTTPFQTISCVEFGATPPPLATQHIQLSQIDIGIDGRRYIENSGNLREWVASTRVLAAIDSWPTILNSELTRLTGEGWYRCWLRFVLRCATTESEQRRGSAGDIQSAFRELTVDTHPFTGEPRACDLYVLHSLIRETLKRGLTLLQNQQDWEVALAALEDVSGNTGSRLDREDGGPVTTGALLELLNPYVSSGLVDHQIEEVISNAYTAIVEIGTYYPTHAEYALVYAKLLKKAGNENRANEIWDDAAKYLCAYGFHKDVTLFDLVESVDSLRPGAASDALRAIQDLQPLIGATRRHTDHRETKHLPNCWFRELLKLDAAAASEVLANGILPDGQMGWVLRRAVDDFVKTTGDGADPFLLNGLLSSMKFHTDHESSVEDDVSLRTSQVERIYSQNQNQARHILENTSGEIAGDLSKYAPIAETALANISENVGIPFYPNPNSPYTKETYPSISSKKNLIQKTFNFPAFSQDSSMGSLLRDLRLFASEHRWNDDNTWSQVIMPLGYRLVELASTGSTSEVERVLKFLAQDIQIHSSEGVHPAGQIASYLENSGLNDLAAIAYALGYGVVLSGFGYLRANDSGSTALRDKAYALNQDLAKRTISDHLANSFGEKWFNIGTTRAVIQSCSTWCEPAELVQIWRSAYDVVSERLPLQNLQTGFGEYVLEHEHPWSDDESIVLILLSRIGEPDQNWKARICSGLVVAIRHNPQSVPRPLNWALSRDLSWTSILLTLQTIFQTETAPYNITTGISDNLQSYAMSGIWGVQVLAASLLQRIGITTTPPNTPPDPLSLPPGTIQPSICNAQIGIPLLTQIWPAIQSLTDARFHYLFNASPVHTEKERNRASEALGRGGNSRPGAPVLGWGCEMALLALHIEMVGFRNTPAGANLPTVLEKLYFDSICPATTLHLGKASSRDRRPNWSLPHVNGSNVGILKTVEAGPQEGWKRLGWFETEFRRTNGRTHQSPDTITRATGGAFYMPQGEEVPEGALPFLGADDYQYWFSDNTRSPSGIPPGPIVGLARADDWLGRTDAIFPDNQLKHLLRLTPPPFGTSLEWLDENGNPALKIRYWRILDREDYYADSPSLEGVDLIIREDLIETIEQHIGGQLRDYEWITSQSIST